MAIHPDFPTSPHSILNPDICWFPADEALRETSYEKLLPPLVHELRKKVTDTERNSSSSKRTNPLISRIKGIDSHDDKKKAGSDFYITRRYKPGHGISQNHGNKRA